MDKEIKNKLVTRNSFRRYCGRFIFIYLFLYGSDSYLCSIGHNDESFKGF